jgi:hypothetical protein
MKKKKKKRIDPALAAAFRSLFLIPDDDDEIENVGPIGCDKWWRWYNEQAALRERKSIADWASEWSGSDGVDQGGKGGAQ